MEQGRGKSLQGGNCWATRPNQVWQQLSTGFVKIATIKIAAIADCFLEAGSFAESFLRHSYLPNTSVSPLTCENTEAEERARGVFKLQPVRGVTGAQARMRLPHTFYDVL